MYSATKAGAYTFRSEAIDGVGNAELITAGLWDTYVKSVKRKGDRLQVTFNKAAANAAGLKKLAVTANGKEKAEREEVPEEGDLRRAEAGRKRDRAEGEDARPASSASPASSPSARRRRRRK